MSELLPLGTRPNCFPRATLRLYLFGSVARGDQTLQSDVDLIADFDKSKRYTLLTLGRLESRLADLLGTKVDLSSPDWMKESVRKQALIEAVRAFWARGASPGYRGEHAVIRLD